MKITVTLDVYSGRPNPEWMLEGTEADTLSHMLQGLSPCKAPVPMDGLGYRGFILTLDKGGRKETIHVYAGMIWRDGDEGAILADEHGAERRLLHMAKEQGHGGLLEDLGVKPG